MNSRIAELKRFVDNQKGRLEQIQEDIKQTRAQVKVSKKSLREYEKAQVIIQTVAKNTQQELEYHISDLVSSALDSIFKEPYTFKVKFVIKRGKTECELLFEKNGEEFSPLLSSGGGVIDVASFALRIALWTLQTPRTRNVIMLDEPFRFLSKDLIPKASLLLKELSKKLKVQFIVITHIEGLTEEADKIFKVENKKGVSKTMDILSERIDNL